MDYINLNIDSIRLFIILWNIVFFIEEAEKNPSTRSSRKLYLT